MKNRSLDEAGEWRSPQICFFENWEARERAKRAPEEKKLKEAQLNELKFDSEDLPRRKTEEVRRSRKKQKKNLSERLREKKRDYPWHEEEIIKNGLE